MEEKENLLNTLKEVSNDEGIYTQYLAIQHSKLKEANLLHQAKEEGHELELAEGHKLGQVEGAAAKEIEVIKNMLKEGLDYNFVSKVTGKTIEEINEIENDMLSEE